MMKKDKIRLFTGLSILACLFFIIFVSFYSNRDSIYYFLNGNKNINGNETLGDNKTDNPRENISNTLNTNNNHIEESVEYLQNIVFLGDSITQGFDIYRDLIKVDGENVFQNAGIVAMTGYGTRHAVADISANSVNLIYEDKPMRPEDIIAKRYEKYVFICFGLNDLSWIKTDEYIENYRTLIDNIQKKNPDKNIVILSITPLVAGNQGGKMTNSIIAQANNLLIKLSEEYKIPFVDWASAIRNENDALYAALSSDGYCHLNIEAYNRLAEYLLQYPVE